MAQLDFFVIVLLCILLVATSFTGVLALVYNKKLTKGFFIVAKNYGWPNRNRIMYQRVLFLFGLALIVTGLWISYVLITVLFF